MRRRGSTHDVSPAVIWAAIDCSGAYAVGGPGRGEVVLGRMTAEIRRLPEEGERCVVVAWPLGEDGRKLYAGTALLGADEKPLAVARQIIIDPETRSRRKICGFIPIPITVEVGMSAVTPILGKEMPWQPSRRGRSTRHPAVRGAL